MFCPIAHCVQVAFGGRVPVVAALTLLEKEDTAVEQQQQRQDASASAGASTRVEQQQQTKQKQGSSKWKIDESELLTSNNEHRAWTFGPMAVLTAALAVAAGHVHGVADGASAASAMFAAYVLADFGTGVFHWAVDNYGDGSTPMFGKQIAAFQGHHQRPWTITRREFCNNLHQVGCGGRVGVQGLVGALVQQPACGGAGSRRGPVNFHT